MEARAGAEAAGAGAGAGNGVKVFIKDDVNKEDEAGADRTRLYHS